MHSKRQRMPVEAGGRGGRFLTSLQAEGGATNGINRVDITG